MVKDSNKSVRIRIHVFIYRLPHLKSRMNRLANGFSSFRGTRRKSSRIRETEGEMKN